MCNFCDIVTEKNKKGKILNRGKDIVCGESEMYLEQCWDNGADSYFYLIIEEFGECEASYQIKFCPHCSRKLVGERILYHPPGFPNAIGML
ncbi:hypothetical protein KGF47_18050 [Clostridioides sp. ZZV13-5731]|uniref:hypothetical protein n=1 Tax=Clostridioides sp. ZZV13-5731 TaxID=2811485 RepID=UPI001D128A9F|nr:hypothetical protein [Clostridioides sp. ZZV13-5731]